MIIAKRHVYLDLSRKSLLVIRDRAQLLDSMEDLRVRQVLALMDICLPDLVGGLVVEVLGGE